MTVDDDDRRGDDGVNETSEPVKRDGKRTRWAVGAVGLAAVLGAGAYAITTQVGDHGEKPAARSAPMAASHGKATADSVNSAEANAQEPSPGTPSPSASQTKSVRQRIDDARKAAAKAGYPLAHPLNTAGTTPGGKVDVQNTGSLKEGGTMRIITAHFDLTGQRELLWAADDGEKVGDARCTQKFHFSNDMKPSVKPTMMLCWQTSKAKSVAIVAVAAKGRPSADDVVAEIDKQWQKLS